MILFVSCEAPSAGVSEADSNTFEQNVQTIKDTWISRFLKKKILIKQYHLWQIQFSGQDLMEVLLELNL